MMTRWCAAALAVAVVAGAGAARAQDALSAGPGIFKKVLETDRVRILEANFKPGAKAGVHSVPDHILYMLTDGTLVLKPAGRTPYEMTFTPGEALSLPAQTRGLENDGEKPVRALLVELKGSARTGARVAAAGKRAAKSKRRRRR